MSVLAAMKSFFEHVQMCSPVYGLNVDYYKRACLTKLLDIFGEMRMIYVLQATDFDASDMAFPFIEQIADLFCDLSHWTKGKILESFMDFLSWVLI